MNVSLNPKQIVRSLSRFLHRYHVLLFVLVAAGGLSAATFVLYHTAMSAQTVEVTPTQSQFDEATMSKIKQLRSSSDASTPLNPPPGRSNPFQE